MKQRLLRTLALCSVLALGACSNSHTLNSNEDRNFTVFYNNDNFGYIEPCGCRITPIGGMHRRWNGITKVAPMERVFVDAGNLLFKSKGAPEYLAPQWYEEAIGVIEAYNLLRADAVEPGETDFALGLQKFRELTAKAKFPFISANIIEKKTGKLLLAPSVLLERNGVKIGIFGVFRPDLSLPSELEAKDPVVAAAEQVKELRDRGANFIIALSHQGYDQDKVFAQAVKGINLIVGASSQALLQKPSHIADSDIVQLSSQGQMLGQMDYTLSGSSNFKLTNFLVDELNSDYDKSPAPTLPNPMYSLKEVTNIRIAEANKKLDEKLWEAHKANTPTGYQTFINCRACHSAQAKFQEGTLHAASMLTLISHKKENDLNCIKCHSVGLGAPQGFSSVATALRKKDGTNVSLDAVIKSAGLEKIAGSEFSYRTNPAQIRPDVARWIASLKKMQVDKSFLGVQCENCHGPRPDHPFDSDASSNSGKVLTTRCLECHNKEQMPSWYDAKGAVKPEELQAAVKRMGCPSAK